MHSSKRQNVQVAKNLTWSSVLLQAWAEFKGKLTEGGQDNPASWKTRLRCALNKSPEFTEVMERAQLDISEPYKVYRLVPINEQGETRTHRTTLPEGFCLFLGVYPSRSFV